MYVAGARGGGATGGGRSAASACPPATSANALAIKIRFMPFLPDGDALSTSRIVRVTSPCRFHLRNKYLIALDKGVTERQQRTTIRPADLSEKCRIPLTPTAARRT